MRDFAAIFPVRRSDMGGHSVFFQGEKALVYTGLFGFFLGAVCAVYSLAFGALTPPEGDLTKAISFNFAIGLFLLTTAALLPLAGFTAKGRKIFRRSYIVFALYSYGIETIQHFRGLDPRFSQHGQVSDLIFSGIFALVSLLLIGYYVIFGGEFFKKNAMYSRPAIILGIRYGMITTMLSFAAGLWIIALQSRYTGTDGNIIWFHGMGFHGLQMIPLLGWLLEGNATKHHLIHIGGIAWVLAIVCTGIQTVLGRSVFELSVLMLLAYTCVLVWAAAACIAFLKFKQNRKTMNKIAM